MNLVKFLIKSFYECISNAVEHMFIKNTLTEVSKISCDTIEKQNFILLCSMSDNKTFQVRHNIFSICLAGGKLFDCLDSCHYILEPAQHVFDTCITFKKLCDLHV